MFPTPKGIWGKKRIRKKQHTASQETKQLKSLSLIHQLCHLSLTASLRRAEVWPPFESNCSQSSLRSAELNLEEILIAEDLTVFLLKTLLLIKTSSVHHRPAEISTFYMSTAFHDLGSGASRHGSKHCMDLVCLLQTGGWCLPAFPVHLTDFFISQLSETHSHILLCCLWTYPKQLGSI